VATQLGVGREVVRGRQVQRHPHRRGLQDLAVVDRGLEVALREAFDARGERDVRRGRVLALQRRQPTDGVRCGDALTLDQELARGERRRELFA
jgi:hypothetical protein